MTTDPHRHTRFLASLTLGPHGSEHHSLLECTRDMTATNFTELIQSLPRSSLEGMYISLYTHLEHVVQHAEYLEESEVAMSQRQTAVQTLHVLAHITEAAVGDCINGNSGAGANKFISATLYQSLLLLHSILLSLPHPSCTHLQNQLSLLFEKVYLLSSSSSSSNNKTLTIKATVEVPDVSEMSKEMLLPMTLCYLLLRSLETDSSASDSTSSSSANISVGGKKSDILRLYNMRHGFNAFDYTDEESSEMIKQLLLRCYSHPLYIRTIEGRRFLSYIFVALSPDDAAVNTQIMKLIHECIKYQLPMCKATWLTYYADLYVRAWKMVAGGESNNGGKKSNKNDTTSSTPSFNLLLPAYEENILQDLMYLSIHSSHPKTCFAIQSLLSQSFHSTTLRKASRLAEGMLCRMYEPILWRSLVSANAQVRKHAVEVLIDVFPLVNVEMDGSGNGSVEREKEKKGGKKKHDNIVSTSNTSTSAFTSNDELLQHQFTTLLTLLTDSDITIRLLSITGVCKILCAYWELIPLGVCKQFLLHLVKKNIRDACTGSYLIRVGVINGLKYLMDNILSHSLLKVLLPLLKDYLFDASEQVQSAMCDLLHTIKGIKSIRYYDIVPLEYIHHAIASCTSHAVRQSLIKLILNSYFPASSSSETRGGSSSGNDKKTTIHSCLIRTWTLLRSNLPVWIKIMCAISPPTSQGGENPFEVIVSESRRYEFALELWKILGRNVEKQKDVFNVKSKSKKRSSVNDNEEDDPFFLSITSDSLFIESILGVLPLLFSSLNEDFIQEREDDLIQIFSLSSKYSLTLLLSTLGTLSSSARMNLIRFSSYLPLSCSPDLSSISLPHLLSLTSDSPESEYGPVLECMMKWGRGDEVLSEIAMAVSAALEYGSGSEVFELGMNEKERNERGESVRRKVKEEIQKKKQQQQQQQQNGAMANNDKDEKEKKKKSGRGSKKSSSKKNTAQSSSTSNDESSTASSITGLMHPHLALKYLAYLFAQEQTRLMILKEYVVWRSPINTSNHVSTEQQQQETGACTTGALDHILTTLSTHLISSFQHFFDTHLGTALTTTSQHQRCLFLSEAVQVEMKVNLHVHGWRKLVTQKANQMEVEKAEERAKERNEAINAHAEEEKKDDTTNNNNNINNISLNNTTNLINISLLHPSPQPLITHIELFPRNYEQIMDFTAYVLVPMWKAVVERDVIGGGGGNEEEEQEEEEERKEEKEESDTKSRKRSKKSHTTSTTTSTSSSSSTSSLSSLLTSHVLFISQFTCELLTLGYYHPLCPMRQIGEVMSVLGEKITDVNNDSMKDEKEKKEQQQQKIHPSTLTFLTSFLPISWKSFYHLSLLAVNTPNFAVAGTQQQQQQPEGALTLQDWSRYLHALSILSSSSSIEVQQTISTHPTIKQAMSESVKLFTTASSSVKVRIAVVSSLLDTILPSIKNNNDGGGDIKLSSLSAYSSLLLSTISRSPACITSLPRVMQYRFTQQQQQQQQQQSSSEELRMKLGNIIQVLAQMAEVNVKAEKKRHIFLSTLLECTNLIASSSSSVPAISATIPPPAAVVPFSSPSRIGGSSSNPVLLLSPSVVTLAPTVSNATTLIVGQQEENDESGVAPMQLDGMTPVKVKREPMPQVDDEADKENTHTRSQQKNSQQPQQSQQQEDIKPPSAMKKPAAIATPASISSSSNSMLDQLKASLTEQMQALSA